MSEQSPLIQAAKDVLRKNDQKFYTSPAGDLYPHQWLWDSCFIAIGLRHVDVGRAQTELTSLLRGQWVNGMLPNMIFKDDGLYAQDANIWRSNLSVLAPDEVNTSGITQPPMLAEAVVRVGQKLSKAERRTWYQTMYPALVDYHMWLYRERDPKQTGLVLQLHPYETGLDNTPPWIEQLHKHHRPWWAKAIEASHLVNLVNLVRRDTRHVTPGQRMDTMDALLFYDLIRKLRAKSYDSQLILKKSYLTIEDVTFNSIFIRANEHLCSIAELLDRPLPDELDEAMTRSRQTFEQLWDSYSSQYYSRNYKTKKLLRTPSLGTLMPLYAGCISKERAEKLVAMLHRKDFFEAEFPVPSVPLGSPKFEPLRYWQGPTWINTNWLINDGLQRYGYKAEAKHIREQSLKLVADHGFYEYFSPLNGDPAGAKDFSWTAALALDWLS
jgi:hypothetical protein